MFADGKRVPRIMLLEQSYQYGCEFYGAQSVVGLTPLTDKCFLSMSQAMSSQRGVMLTGSSCVGKTETVKVWARFLFASSTTYQ